MTDKTSNNFAIEWSEEICDWVMDKAEDQDIAPEVAVYGTLAAAIVLARSVGMNDNFIKNQFNEILLKEFPESMIQEDAHK